MTFLKLNPTVVIETAQLHAEVSKLNPKDLVYLSSILQRYDKLQRQSRQVSWILNTGRLELT